MLNAPSCLTGPLPNNLDIDLSEVMQPGGYKTLGAMNRSQVELSSVSGALQSQQGIVPSQK